MTALSPSGANAVKQECKNDSDCEVFAVKNVKSAFSEGEAEPVYSYVGRLLF